MAGEGRELYLNNYKIREENKKGKVTAKYIFLFG